MTSPVRSSLDRAKRFFRLLFIRWGWKRCDHRDVKWRNWREPDGTLMMVADCPDCGWHDFGHVHE